MFDVSHILTTTVSLTIVSIVLSILGCFIAFHQRGGGSVSDFLKYAFPRDLVTRRSCYQDAGFIVLKQLIRPLLAAPILLLTSAKCAVLTYGVLVLAFGSRAQAAMPIELFVALLIPAVLVQDFLRFGSH